MNLELSRDTSVEAKARALRIADQTEMLPRYRDVGRLRLDLLARDGFAGGRPLSLHPREFALIWRLADTPGIAVGKRALVSDVWRLTHMPDTNSLAVHIFRLRGKLTAAGFGELVQTAPAGGYILKLAQAHSLPEPFVPAQDDGLEVAAMALSVEQSLRWEPRL